MTIAVTGRPENPEAAGKAVDENISMQSSTAAGLNNFMSNF